MAATGQPATAGGADGRACHRGSSVVGAGRGRRTGACGPAGRGRRAASAARAVSPDLSTWRPCRGSLSAVRLTEFWHRMDEQFGPAYARSVSKDHVLAGLGGRTADQALADGEDAKAVWRAVCEAFELPGGPG